MAKTRPHVRALPSALRRPIRSASVQPMGAESGRVGQAGEITEEAKLAGVEGVLQALQE